MASPGINSIAESERQPDHRDGCAYRHDLRHQLIRLGQFLGKRRRDTQTEPLRRLMAAVLCEAVNRFERNLFQTSLYGRCEFVEAEQIVAGFDLWQERLVADDQGPAEPPLVEGQVAGDDNRAALVALAEDRKL
jgi:hypothetical protein